MIPVTLPSISGMISYDPIKFPMALNLLHFAVYIEAVARRFSVKEVFLKISQISPGNTKKVVSRISKKEKLNYLRVELKYQYFSKLKYQKILLILNTYIYVDENWCKK